MAITLTANYQKRLALPGYSSHSFQVSLESEITDLGNIQGEVAMRGEKLGCLVVRKHIAKCFKGYPGSAGLRRKLYATEKIDEMITILEDAAKRGDPRVVPS